MGLRRWVLKALLIGWLKESYKENEMFKKFVDLFVGSESKKRYITALYVAIRGAFMALEANGIISFQWPAYIDQMALAFGIWAGADALKKLESK